MFNLQRKLKLQINWSHLPSKLLQNLPLLIPFCSIDYMV